MTVPAQFQGPFSLLYALYGDQEMSTVFSMEQTVKSWLRTEAGLAVAQGQIGRISSEDAEAIGQSCTSGTFDLDQLIEDGRLVGYPILGLVRQIARSLPEGANGRVHLGATTQDIMDTGLAIQLHEATHLLRSRVVDLGDALSDLCEAHRDTPIAARTHGQQAVPTTFGAKMAVFLEQTSRRLETAQRVYAEVAVVSLHGAGGTSAALGEEAVETRRILAQELGLEYGDVPWHVNRDRVVAFSQLCDDISALSARLAREIIDLSRTEIAEVREPGGHLAGASSTMPQKVNPVLSEAVLGLSIAASAMAPAIRRAAEAGHERSAGEWQAEWYAVPEIAVLASSAIRTITIAVRGLQVFRDRMSANLRSEQSLLMAEAYMIRLAPAFGREQAHELVYAAAVRARATKRDLADILAESSDLTGMDVSRIEPTAYLGECASIVRSSLENWRVTRGVAT